ncbi:MAG: znuC 3 [Parcubacteria group bacterium]|nr:znuC 3 [Parcubacteria group bacterium]
MSNSQPIVFVENLSFSYDGKTDVIEDVSLSVCKGDYLGLIGPNGGGKTTLLKLMLRQLTPERGTVSILGKDISRFREWYRIGYVSQQATGFDSLFPATVEEVVMMGRYARRGLFRGTASKDRIKAKEALTQVGMGDYLNRRISDLSGGQKQRVFLARALTSEPEIIVLDEPTTGVDHESEEQFYALLARLNKEQGMTLILVSHDLERIAREASCVAVMEKNLRYYSDPYEAVARERHMDSHH